MALATRVVGWLAGLILLVWCGGQIVARLSAAPALSWADATLIALWVPIIVLWFAPLRGGDSAPR